MKLFIQLTNDQKSANTDQYLAFLQQPDMNDKVLEFNSNYYEKWQIISKTNKA